MKFLKKIALICCLTLISSNFLGYTTANASTSFGLYNDCQHYTSLMSTNNRNKSYNKKTYPLTDKYVKSLGRTYYYDNALWLALSGSGAEFNFIGKSADITILGDEMATTDSWADTSHARIGIYVNDVLVIDDILKEREKTYKVYESRITRPVNIKVVKLSESMDSTLGIKSIITDLGSRIKPTANKSHKIEFIGDSLTCGFGVDDENPYGAYTTATEDVTKTFAYKTADALHSDYSMVSYSGFGIISGYTDNGQINTEALLPPYYDKIGFSYGNFNNKLEVASLPWDFNKFIPDLIVINLGSNDDSYCNYNSERQNQFKDGYVKFLKQVRSKNPNSTILCTLGIAGDSLYPSLQKALKEYTSETGDTNVNSMQFDAIDPSDGFAACFHPTEKTHQKSANKLTAKIKELMNW